MAHKQQKYRLSEQEKSEYRGLVSDAFDAAHDFTGSEETYDVLMDRLIAMEEFVRDRNDRTPSDKLEAEFAKQASYVASQFNTVSGILGHASNRVYGMLSRLTDLKDLLNALDVGGAHIDYSDNVYVLTDQGFPSDGGGGEIDRNLKEFRKQPRLAILVKELSTIGIYTDDLVVRVGQVFEDKVRKLPYIAVEIPRLGKQVAICDQYGEATFVSQNILHPNIWASYTKRELAALDGVEKVPFGMKWPMKVCNLLAYGTSDMTPAQFRKPDKVDVGAYERSRTTKPCPLSEEMILNHMLLHLVAHSGRWPHGKTGKVETLPNEYWHNFEMALRNGYRGLDGGISVHDLAVNFTVREACLYIDKNGQAPNRDSGPLANFPDITWEMIDDAFLAKGGKAKISLERLLIDAGLAAPITSNQIFESALLHMVENDCSWPSAQTGGTVINMPEKTWHDISNLFLRGDLEEYPAEYSIPLFIKDKVREQAVKFLDQHGRLPTNEDGPIPDYEFVTLGMINDAFLNGGASKISLEGVFVETGLLEKDLDYNEDIIWNMMLEYLGNSKPPVFPTPHSKDACPIEGETWQMLNHYLEKGQKGLPGKSSLFKLSLRKTIELASKFRDTNGRLPNRSDSEIEGCPGVSWKMVEDAFLAKRQKKMSLEDIFIEGKLIEKSAFAGWTDENITRHALLHTADKKRFPSATSGDVGTWVGKKWGSVQAVIENGRHGITKGRGIYSLIHREIVAQAEKFIGSNGRLPTAEDGCLPDYDFVTWDDVEQALWNRAYKYRISLNQFLLDLNLTDDNPINDKPFEI